MFKTIQLPSEADLIERAPDPIKTQEPTEVIEEFELEDFATWDQLAIMRVPVQEGDETFTDEELEVFLGLSHVKPRWYMWTQEEKHDEVLEIIKKLEMLFLKNYGVTYKKMRDKKIRRSICKASVIPENWAAQFPVPWERLKTPGNVLESEREFQSFQTYLHLGIHRSIFKTAKATAVNPDNTLLNYLRKISERWQWRFRSEAYDRWLAEEDGRRLADVKAQAMNKSVEVLAKLNDLNSKMLSGEVDTQMDPAWVALQQTRQSNTIENATRLHGAVFGTKQEVKADMSVNLAHAILTSDVKTIDI